MDQTDAYERFGYTPSPDQARGTPARHPVVVVGAGPVGLVAALDLAERGQPVVVLDEDDRVSVGSRAICWAKRTLEICDRLGLGERVVEKGVTWQLGRVFFRDRPVYSFDMLPETAHKMPAFVNLQQYHFEAFAVEAAQADPRIDLRWKNRVTEVATGPDGARLTVETPDGPYSLDADWVLACDGASSPIRRMLGLEFEGRVFQDRFLIADVVMQADFPTERWFWFDPPFNPGQSALLHKQADDVWRIDLQLGWDADPEAEKKPENVVPRLKAMLGEDAEFELDWVSVYTFQCRRLTSFRHGPVLFVGDSAHQVSPFGARGGNGGVQDADNLAWKLDLVLRGLAPESLIESYDSERLPAADENILHSTRSTDFITPKSRVSREFRDAVLALSEDHPFARRLVNSGRLSVPHWLDDTPLSTPDSAAGDDAFAGAMRPGAPCADAPAAGPAGESWLLEILRGGFHALVMAEPGHDYTDDAAALAARELPVRLLVVGRDIADTDGLVAARYDLRPGTTYLIRPDQHVAARFRAFDRAALAAAADRAAGRAPAPAERERA